MSINAYEIYHNREIIQWDMKRMVLIVISDFNK